MKELLHNSRFYVLLSSVLLSIALYFFIASTISYEQLQIIRLNQLFGLLSLGYFYVALLAGPFCYTFPSFPLKKLYLHSRRALGVSAFYFGLLHALLAFFGQLGGFEGLGFLTANYVTAVGLGAIALFILSLLAATSFDAVIKKMGFPNWKLLQRFVYLAGVLILIHTIMLGTHFSSLFAFVPQVTFLALAFLLFLESQRTDAWLQRRFGLPPQFSYVSLVVVGLLFIGAFYLFIPFPGKENASLSIHQTHTAQNSMDASMNMLSMQGDTTLRYTVGLIKPDDIVPNQLTPLRFEVFNAASGSQVTLFKKLLGKDAHLVIVNNGLTYYTHIHLQQQGNELVGEAVFPKADFYRMYLTYQPVNAVEQQVAFSLGVGATDGISSLPIDTNLTKIVGQYAITMTSEKPLQKAEIENGVQKITFNIKDAQTRKPVTTLKPYLGTFGHMVMINQKTYTYLHIHPQDLTALKPDQNGGPDVTFLPVMLHDPVTPGVYRVFAEFNPDGKYTVVDYTVRVN